MTQKETSIVYFVDCAAFDCINNMSELNDRAGYSNNTKDQAHMLPQRLCVQWLRFSPEPFMQVNLQSFTFNATSSSETALTAISEHLLVMESP